MKLILTSSGLNSPRLRREFARLLEKKLEESKVLMLYALRKPEFISYVNDAGKELERSGILLPHVRYVDIANEKAFSFRGYDAVYVCGREHIFHS